MIIILVLYGSMAMANERFALKRNEWHQVDQDLKFRVTKVLNDSRCPEGSQCIWAGRVSIEIEFHNGKTIDKVAFGPTHGIGDTIKIASFPINMEDRSKNFLEGFSWKDKTYLLKRVLPYPGKNEIESYIFELKKLKSTQIELDLDQWEKLADKFKFKVIKVISDSRCPEAARCARAGEVIIQLMFREQTKIYNAKFTTDPFLSEKNNPLTFPPQKGHKDKIFQNFIWEGKTYDLIEVRPYPGKKEEQKFIFKLK